MLDSALSPPRSPSVRSKVTNNFRKSPPGIDGRSLVGRRWRDTLEALVSRYGVDDPEKLRALAGLRVALEQTRDAVLRGDVARSEDIVRLENLIGRREKELAAKARQRQAEAPSLREHLAKAAKAGGP
jgi:hypothetical protein